MTAKKRWLKKIYPDSQDVTNNSQILWSSSDSDEEIYLRLSKKNKADIFQQRTYTTSNHQLTSKCSESLIVNYWSTTDSSTKEVNLNSHCSPSNTPVLNTFKYINERNSEIYNTELSVAENQCTDLLANRCDIFNTKKLNLSEPSVDPQPPVTPKVHSIGNNFNEKDLSMISNKGSATVSNESPIANERKLDRISPILCYSNKFNKTGCSRRSSTSSSTSNEYLESTDELEKNCSEFCGTGDQFDVPISSKLVVNGQSVDMPSHPHQSLKIHGTCGGIPNNCYASPVIRDCKLEQLSPTTGESRKNSNLIEKPSPVLDDLFHIRKICLNNKEHNNVKTGEISPDIFTTTQSIEGIDDSFPELKLVSSTRNNIRTSTSDFHESAHLTESIIEDPSPDRHVPGREEIKRQEYTSTLNNKLLTLKNKSIYQRGHTSPDIFKITQSSQVIDSDSPEFQNNLVQSDDIESSEDIDPFPSQHSSEVNTDTNSTSNQDKLSYLYHQPGPRKKHYKKGSLAALLQKTVQLQKTRVSIWQHELYMKKTAIINFENSQGIGFLVVKKWKEYGHILLECCFSSNKFVNNEYNNCFIIVIGLCTVLSIDFEMNHQYKLYPPFSIRNIMYNSCEIPCYFNVTKLVALKE